MRMKLKRLALQQFKGINQGKYDFHDLTNVSGMNGVGKSTLATAWYWLTTDKDYALKSNPPVFPLGVEEALPRVDATVEVNGKEIVLSKFQKARKSKPDENGVQKVSLANSYEINSVPKSERDFRSYMEVEGIDWDLFLQLSHPDVFTGMKKDAMREALFAMASEQSDLDIAKIDEDTADVANLLETGYKVDEITAIHKATVKKAKEESENIPERITGLEMAKSDIDVRALEVEKKSLESQIASLETQLNDGDDASEEYSKLQAEIMQMKFDLSGVANKLVEEHKRKCEVLYRKVFEAEGKYKESYKKFGKTKIEIEDLESHVEKCSEKQTNLKQTYTNAKEGQFPEHEKTCDKCGREFDAKKTEELLENFEKDKARRMKGISDEATYWKNQKIVAREKINVLKQELEILEEESDKALEELNKHRAVYDASTGETDVAKDENYQSMQGLIKAAEETLSNLETHKVDNSDLQIELESYKQELAETIRQIGKASNNADIDKQIAELRSQQRQYEQNKADSEKILYQLDLLSRKKNELLAESINSKFGLVKWKLFDFLKNGEYREACEAMVDGKDMSTAMSYSLILRAKLDIVNSFQNHYDMYVPVFLDNSEAINPVNIPKMDTQLITLNVTGEESLEVRHG